VSCFVYLVGARPFGEVEAFPVAAAIALPHVGAGMNPEATKRGRATSRTSLVRLTQPRESRPSARGIIVLNVHVNYRGQGC
jgi:hypothetical protein